MACKMSDDNTRHYGEKPYQNKQLLEELYYEKKMSLNEIADELGCGATTVGQYMDEFGLERRSIRDARYVSETGSKYSLSFYTDNQGAVRHDHDTGKVTVHRLLAVAMFGFDEVAEKTVLHKNSIPWDNRPKNIELVEKGEVSEQHNTKIKGEERKRVADLYEHTDKSSYDIADEYDVAASTVQLIHKEFYGDDNGGESE